MRVPSDSELFDFVEGSLLGCMNDDADSSTVIYVANRIKRFILVCLTEQEECSILEHEEQGKNAAPRS